MPTAEQRTERIEVIRARVASATHYQDEGRICPIKARGPNSFTVQLNWGQMPSYISYADVTDSALFYTEADMLEMKS